MSLTSEEQQIETYRISSIQIANKSNVSLKETFLSIATAVRVTSAFTYIF